MILKALNFIFIDGNLKHNCFPKDLLMMVTLAFYFVRI